MRAQASDRYDGLPSTVLTHPFACERRRMVLEALTPEEQTRHERAIEKIRRRLFCKYEPDEYFIVQASEHVFPAYAESRWNAGCGSYRVLHLGGVSYSVNCADDAGLSRFAVSHDEADRFNFWLSAAKGHTLNALSIRFRQLDEVPHGYVSSYRRANLASAYVGKRER